MPKSAETGKRSGLNYILNISIIVLLLVCAYLVFSMVSKQFLGKDKEVKEQDTLKTTVTNQPNLTVQVDVKNGSGENGAAQIFTEYLRAKGFDVVEIGNYTTNDEAKTLILDRNGNKNNCKKIAIALGLSERNIIQQLNPSLYLDATVVIGKDFKELKPYLEKPKK